MGVVVLFRPIEQSRLDSLKSMSGQQVAEALDAADPDAVECDVDKSWDGIHYLLTGTSSHRSPFKLFNPLSWFSKPAVTVEDSRIPSILAEVMAGGVDMRTSPFDFDTAYFDASKVSDLHNAFSSISNDILLARFDGAAMTKANLYLAQFWNRDREVAIDYLTENLNQLRSFFAHTSQSGMGALRITY